MYKDKTLTHSELIQIGAKWLKKKCGVVLVEQKSFNDEIPDIIGFNSNGSFVIEAKTSRADFLADQKKPFRITPNDGMGDWRFFITPKDLIRIEELPNDWGLLEVNDKGKIVNEYNPFGKGNIYSQWIRKGKNIKAEWNVMYSALLKTN